MEQKYCQQCGKEITTAGRNRFCSVDCQTSFFYKYKKAEEKSAKNIGMTTSENEELDKSIFVTNNLDTIIKKIKRISKNAVKPKNKTKRVKTSISYIKKIDKRREEVAARITAHIEKMDKRKQELVSILEKFNKRKEKHISIIKLENGLAELKDYQEKKEKLSISISDEKNIAIGNYLQENEKQSYKKLVCEYCGKEFEHNSVVKYCSTECKTKGMLKPRVCMVCNKIYQPTTVTQYYCAECKIMEAKNNEKKRKFICEVCGKEYIGTYRARLRYCSAECKMIGGEKKRTIKKICQYCGKEFMTSWESKKFCDRKCKDKANVKIRAKKKKQINSNDVTPGNVMSDATMLPNDAT